MHFKIVTYFCVFILCIVSIEKNYGQKDKYISQSGLISRWDFRIDKEGNVYTLSEINPIDSFWVNNLPINLIKDGKNDPGTYSSLILSKFSEDKTLQRHCQIFGKLSSRSFDINENGNSFIALSSNSDTLVFNDSVIVNSKFTFNLILLKIGRNFNLEKVLLVENGGLYYTDIKVSNHSLYLGSGYCDTMRIINESLICPKRTPHTNGYFVCCLSINLDSIIYLKDFEGFGYNSVYDLSLDDKENINFCGRSNARKLIISGVDIDMPEINRPWFFIGSLSKSGKLNWIYKTSSDFLIHFAPFHMIIQVN